MVLTPEPLDPGGAMPLDGDSQRLARLAGGALAVLSAGSLAGASASLYLVNHYPLLLALLSPIGRHLILVAPLVDPVVFVVAVTARRMLFYLASHQLGKALGPPGVLWIEARARRFGRFVRWLERIFQRWGKAVVLLAVGPTTSALAGIYGMPLRTFSALAIPSLILRMTLIVWVAERFEAPIRAVLAWIDAHWVEGTVVMVLLIGGYQLWVWRRAHRKA
jgi:membrane protein DedA with SNARE-associated domain